MKIEIFKSRFGELEEDVSFLTRYNVPFKISVIGGYYDYEISYDLDDLAWENEPNE